MVEIPRTEVFTAEATEGCVLLNGPGVARTLEPDIAMYLANILLDAAIVAVEQRSDAGSRHSSKPN